MEKKQYGMVYSDILRNPELSLRAKGLYAILATYADKNRKCFPSIARLSNECFVSRRTIQRLLSELKDKGYIIKDGKYILLKDVTLDRLEP